MGQWRLSRVQGRHLGTSNRSPSHHQLSRRICLNLINGLKSPPFQTWFWFWEKPEVAEHQICALGGLSHLGDLMVHQKTMHEQAHCHDEAASHQLPIAVASWIICIVFVEEYSSLLQNLMQIPCSTCSVILNATATQYTCLLTQWHLLPPQTRTVKSSLFTHVHSSPFSLAARLHGCHTNCSGYINSGWMFSRQTSYNQWYILHDVNYSSLIILVRFRDHPIIPQRRVFIHFWKKCVYVLIEMKMAILS